MVEPSMRAAEDDSLQLIRDLIAEELTVRQRDALFAELEGMPQGEIVRLLGGTRNSVYKLLHDARKALRRALERRGITSFNQIDLLADLSQKGTL
jgi:RNA polymerase sigma-70 factor (ECF subfamily)